MGALRFKFKEEGTEITYLRDRPRGGRLADPRHRKKLEKGAKVLETDIAEVLTGTNNKES